MFSKIKEMLRGDLSQPQLRPATFKEVPSEALEYALWMIGDDEEGIFVPAMLTFGDMGTEDGQIDIQRFMADEQEDGSWDIELSNQQALEFFETNVGMDWDVVLYTGFVTLEGQDKKQDAVFGYARDNLSRTVVSFMRIFVFNGRTNEWAGEIVHLD